MSKCSSFCGGELPPLAFDACKSDPRKGGIPYLLFKTCDVCVPENAFIAGTSQIDRAVWEPLFADCKLRVSTELVGEKGEASTNSLRTASCRPERAVGGTQPIEFKDYTQSDNYADYDFWIELQQNQNAYQVGFFTCDDRFYGFFDFSLDISEIIEDSNEGTSYRQGTITIPDYKLIKPLKADGLLSLAQEYSAYDCSTGGYASESAFVGEDTDFYGCVEGVIPGGGGGGGGCTEPCPPSLFNPYIIRSDPGGGTLPSVQFYLPVSYLEECYGLGEWTITMGPDTTEGSPKVMSSISDLYAYEYLISVPPDPDVRSGSALLYANFLSEGAKYITFELNRSGQPGSVCPSVTNTINFNTGAMATETVVCDYLDTACDANDLWGAVTLTRYSPTEVHLAVDSQFLFDLGCLTGNLAWIEFLSGSPGFYDVATITDGNPEILEFIVPANASPSTTGINMAITTGPALGIFDIGNQPIIWTPPACRRVNITQPNFDIGTLPPYTP